MSIAKDSTLTSGSLRGVTGPLERVPFNAATSSSSGTGPSASIGTSGGQMNRDGSGNRGILIIPASTLPASAVIRDVVYGPTVGVRWQRDNLATTLPFDVVIDGVAYRVNDANPRRDNQVASATDYEALHVVATNLPDRRHTVEVHLFSDGIAGAAKRLEVHGWVGERGKGYGQMPIPTSVGGAGTVVALPAAAAGISYVGTRVKKLHFYNTDTVARTVTVYGSDGVSVWATRVLGAAGTNTADAEVVFDPPRSMQGHKWMADLAAKVNAWTESQ